MFVLCKLFILSRLSEGGGHFKSAGRAARVAVRVSLGFLAAAHCQGFEAVTTSLEPCSGWWLLVAVVCVAAAVLLFVVCFSNAPGCRVCDSGHCGMHAAAVMWQQVRAGAETALVATVQVGHSSVTGSQHVVANGGDSMAHNRVNKTQEEGCTESIVHSCGDRSKRKICLLSLGVSAHNHPWWSSQSGAPELFPAAHVVSSVPFTCDGMALATPDLAT